MLNRLPANQSSTNVGNAVGGNTSGLPTGGQAVADLRGLGGDKTLVLLNGRRIANHPYDGASVDLNIIPITALDRIEVLRDGASAIYGTDAIGGVINFITKRSVEGTNVTVEWIKPEHKGGDERRINVSGGIGDLDKDGFNLFMVADLHDQKVITSQDRPYSQTGVDPARGLDRTSGTTFPANVFDPITKVTGNPYFATGCNPPFSVPRASNGTCRQDYTRQVDNLPSAETHALFAKGTMKFGAGHVATLELLHSDNEINSRTAPPPQTDLQLPKTSKWYPGGTGGVPAIAGLGNGPLTVNWRPLEAGQREILSKGSADRAVLAMEGLLANWDYKGGLSYSTSQSSEDFVGGYVKDSAIATGVRTGRLNPFGLQDATGRTTLEAAALRGEVQHAKNTSIGIDFKASRELMAMAGGNLAVAVGGELRHEEATFFVQEAIATQAASSGLSGSKSKSGDRNIEALFGEVSVPFIKDFDLQLAARFDNYSDVGNTFNPKMSVRYQPIKTVLLRGSASTGFRAPTLFEKNAPQSKNDTNDSYNDPILCPNGVPTPQANPLRDCDLQQFKLQGGNPNLNPEKSTTFTVGVVLEPVKQVTVAIDYWNVHLKDKIGALPEQAIYGNYEKYKARFLRNADGSPLAILDLNENLGEVKTQGIDLGLTLRMPTKVAGNFTFGLDGTYVNQYDYQDEPGGAFIENAGRYASNNPVFRWRHTASVNWRLGNWGATLSQNFKSSYKDQDNSAGQKVDSYSLWNLTGTYTGIKGLALTAGVKNLLDTEPPFSNQGTMFQQGYDPRYTDPVGRALYVCASYSF